MWLERTIFGVETAGIPSMAWPSTKKKLSSLQDEFWTLDELEINSKFSALLLDETELLIEQEVRNGQGEFGAQFVITNNGTIALNEQVRDQDSVVRPIAAEVVRQYDELLQKCDGNVNAQLKSDVELYLDNFSGVNWKDDYLLVMRGDAIRKDRVAQLERSEDSDIFPLSDDTLSLLSKAVAAHNLLINSHHNLANIDKMLLSPGSEAIPASHSELRAIINSVDARKVISASARQALQEASESASTNPDVILSSNIRSSETAVNFYKTVLFFIWKHKKAIGAGLVSVPAAFYTVGHWALENEVMLMNFVRKSQILGIIAERVFAILHALPLL